ncbi:MAG: 50S ribosomal protein L11 methyltransferase [Gammaproteobacteria bacterium]|nr:50S ribosomal protein L11 methyltransferase [Gammaproteobacteria bacterium]
MTDSDWIQIELTATAATAERLADHLTDAGALSVSFEDEADDPVFEPAPGATTLWPRTVVVGLFAPDADVSAVLSGLQRALDLPEPPACRLRRLQERDWVRVWMDRFRPMRFGARLWICPSGQSPADAGPDAVVVTLDPGLAFGTGTHETTALCLEWLDGHLQPGWEVIDYGCGSGILAVAAARLGAGHVHAVDIDPQALYATEENARKNRVAAGIATGDPAALPADPVDCIVANILAGPLIALAPRFAALLRTGGRLVLSGILHDQAAEVGAAYTEAFVVEPAVRRGDWVRLAARRR